MVSLLYDNISRLNEENESDRAGVYHVLGQLISPQKPVADPILQAYSKICHLEPL